MKMSSHIFYTILISLSIIACKNETKESTPETEKEPVIEESVTKKQEDISQKNKRANSVVSKMMFTEESKSFIRYLISVDMIDQLSLEDGPFTVLAPSNVAFNDLTEVQLSSLQNYKEKEFLTTLLKSHIINGNFDSATLVQEIKKNKGKQTLTTLSGAELILSKKGSDIIITDENGTKARIGKSDINGSNGVVHLLDTVLIIN